MQSLISTTDLSLYSTKEAGPIILALAFVLAVGGVGIAAVIICGGIGHVKSMGLNIIQRRAEIVCK